MRKYYLNILTTIPVHVIERIMDVVGIRHESVSIKKKMEPVPVKVERNPFSR